MQKKIKFSENPNLTKTVYGVIIAVLCIAAIIIGIVAAGNRGGDLTVGDNPDDGSQDTVTPPDSTPPEDGKPDGDGDGEGNGDNEGKDPEKLTFIAPVAGKVVKGHSLSQPVFSETLEEWRIHTGIDVSCDDGAQVFCSADGEVSAVYFDAMLGQCVEITHSDAIKTVYSNLSTSKDDLPKVGDKVKCGDKIGTVGDSSISELCEEPHLHFELLVNGTSVNPLDYFSEDSKHASLGISPAA